MSTQKWMLFFFVLFVGFSLIYRILLSKKRKGSRILFFFILLFLTSLCSLFRFFILDWIVAGQTTAVSTFIWNVSSESTHKILRISSLPSGRSPGTIRPLARSLTFQHRAGRLEQLDNLRNSLRFFFTIEQVSQNNQTIREIPRILSSGRSLRTIRPLVKFFVFFLHHRASHLEQLDHLRDPSHFIIGHVVTYFQAPRAGDSVYLF